MDLLKWMAAREAIARDAGQPASQWYVHMDGDSWDFLVLSPTSSEEADKRASELMKQRGLSAGFKAVLEFRQAMAWHTDTHAAVPFPAQQLIDAAKQPSTATPGPHPRPSHGSPRRPVS